MTAYLKGRGFNDNAALKEFSLKYAPVLSINQNLSTLADAIDEAVEESEDTGKELNCDLVARQIFALCATHQERKAAGEAKKTRK